MEPNLSSSTAPEPMRRPLTSVPGVADPMIRLERVSKSYPDGTVAVAELSLDVAPGELCVLVGPSGCGKTTTMRMINRLIEPTTGRILIDGEDVTRGDPVKVRRGIGYVIQQVGPLPSPDHRAERRDRAAPARLVEGRSNGARVGELLELVGLDPETYGPRYPHQLSGGQRQRVGVARALAADPPVLLMDEPFGAVDPIARERLQAEFLRLQDELHKTVVFVTHDVEEAVRLGDRIAVLRQGGHLEQYDTPATVLGAPATDFVADFVGADRGLKRLGVTPIHDDDLEHPPVLHLDDRLAFAAARLHSVGARAAVVLDDEDQLHGWVGVDRLTGAGTVGERARRLEAWVPRDASLKQAFAQMLQHDAGWVAVLDGERLVGVLTPTGLHQALRRSVEADAHDLDPAEVSIETAAHA